MLLDFSNHLLLPLLFSVGLIAGTIDAIAGGGGMITLPLLLIIGVPPHVALGTSKLQGAAGTFVATCSYYRHGLFSLKTIYKGLIFGFIGAVLGAIAGQTLSSDILKKIIPVLLVVILIYTIFSPKLGHIDKKPRVNEFWFYVIFGFTMGFYDGFFGPGTGSLWVFALTFFLGYNFTKATAYAKVFNLKSNIIATVCFMIGGNINYSIALCMMAGQLIGGRLGAHLAIKRGAQIIRPIFISIVSLTILSLAYKNYSGSFYLEKLINYTGMMPLILGLAIFVTALSLYAWKIARTAVEPEAIQK